MLYAFLLPFFASSYFHYGDDIENEGGFAPENDTDSYIERVEEAALDTEVVGIVLENDYIGSAATCVSLCPDDFDLIPFERYTSRATELSCCHNSYILP